MDHDPRDYESERQGYEDYLERLASRCSQCGQETGCDCAGDEDDLSNPRRREDPPLSFASSG